MFISVIPEIFVLETSNFTHMCICVYVNMHTNNLDNIISVFYMAAIFLLYGLSYVI